VKPFRRRTDTSLHLVQIPSRTFPAVSNIAAASAAANKSPIHPRTILHAVFQSLEKLTARFPIVGKTPKHFSNRWKSFAHYFQSLEFATAIFQSLELFFPEASAYAGAHERHERQSTERRVGRTAEPPAGTAGPRPSDWRIAAIMGRINLYYLTGTLQTGYC
jgi:hypothetical protein